MGNTLDSNIPNTRYQHLLVVKVKDCVKNGKIQSYKELTKVNNYDKLDIINRNNNTIYVDYDEYDINGFVKFLNKELDPEQTVWIKKSCVDPEYEYLENEYNSYIRQACKGGILVWNDKENSVVKNKNKIKKNVKFHL